MNNIAERAELCKQIKEIIVEKLMLNIPSEFIGSDQPLVGRGLELDSIDSLEISVAVNMEFGIIVTDDRYDIFSSVNKLADYIEEMRKAEENE